MKEYLEHLSSFNLWANQKFADVLLTATEEQVNKEIQSSFPSITKTLKHILDAETAWWLRMQDSSQSFKFGEDYPGTLEELLQDLLDQSKQWKEYIKSKTETELQASFRYIRLEKEFESRIIDALIHLFNHGTYHRGQLVTMMRQVQISQIPGTDFIAYVRENKL